MLQNNYVFIVVKKNYVLIKISSYFCSKISQVIIIYAIYERFKILFFLCNFFILISILINKLVYYIDCFSFFTYLLGKFSHYPLHLQLFFTLWFFLDDNYYYYYYFAKLEEN